MSFTAADQLQLLQLQACRSIAERKNADEAVVVPNEGNAKDCVEGSRPPSIPKQWRLLPAKAELFPWQKEAIDNWLKQKRGTVKVATGGGKTWFALAVAQEAQRKIDPDLRLVIVVPTIPLMHQWVDDLRKSNLPESCIGMLGGGQECQFENPVRVVVAVLNSARRLLPNLVKKAKISSHLLLVVDECHRVHAKESQQVFEVKPAMTLGLSATPESSTDDSERGDKSYAESVAGKALGPIFYELTLAQALEAGLLAPFEVHHIGIPLTGDEGGKYERLSRKISDLRKELQAVYHKSRSKQGFLAWCQTRASRKGDASAARFVGLSAERKRLLYRAKLRNQAVLGILSHHLDADPSTRCITFHEVIDQVDALFEQAKDLRIPAVLEHSKLPSSLREESLEAFRAGVARAIISARSLVEGFNVPSADVGVIAASSSSVRQRIQSLGRMLRRKEGGKLATVYVLYAMKTEDERIYEQADWDHIVGAERNRFFYWTPKPGETWPQGLEEVEDAPRAYLPRPEDADLETIVPGDPWPARPDGKSFRIDLDGNLRDEEDNLFELEDELRRQIKEINPGRRLKLATTGHLIAFRPNHGSTRGWVYVGKSKKIAKAKQETKISVTKKIPLRLRQSRGVRRIAKSLSKGQEVYALQTEHAQDAERGRAAEELLNWIGRMEQSKSSKIYKVFWDGEHKYWLELGGKIIPYQKNCHH